MKQMSLIEMDGFLKGKCIPRDLKVNETNAEYLVRKFAEAEAKYAALAAENAGLKSEAPLGAIENGRAFADRLENYQFECEGGNLNMCSDWQEFRRCFEYLSEWAMHSQTEHPATDAFLAEIERKAIRKFINSIEHILRDKLSPYDTEEMLETMRIFLEEQGGEQK
ncbi:TPA: hypothetical protein KHV26_003510 [Escherichia coli]|nr:hypothetical protein [Escherichia coli]